jgi:hypothetical protein
MTSSTYAQPCTTLWNIADHLQDSSADTHTREQDALATRQIQDTTA